MRIIAKPILREFWLKNKLAEIPLSDWYKQSKKADWSNLAEIKEVFPHADLVGECIVFNIGGNKYRLITKIKFRAKIIYIRFVLTHNEYDEDKWKKDCRC
ncbi:MAG TPA: type II toxin-antitoxin system HigB family toxin [Pyrinomonadaceae bacterium]|nr:type II toxin-antitoxin system HigB family toxin [Pyrinomonadaceae bacterium]